MSEAPGIQGGIGKESNPGHSGHFKRHDVASNETALKPQESPDSIPTLPKGCKPLTHQVAGHRFGQGRLKLGMLQHVDGSILKPVQPPPRGHCEVNFYSKVFDQNCKDPVLLTLRPFLPKFLGLHRPFSPNSDEESCSPEYLKLEDACRRFRNPSILDIKIGKVSYDPKADAAKIAFESSKYPPQKKLGFQLLGARVSGQSPNEAVFYDKKWGRSLTEETITDGLEIFFSGNKSCRKHLIKAFLERLETILIWFESQSQMQFYSSSILLIYEGEFFDGSSDSDEEFMHKYRSSFPNYFRINQCFRDIDKVLEENISAQDSKDEEGSSNDVAENSDAEQKRVDEQRQQISGDQAQTNAGGATSPNPTFHASGGMESGYSSEADSKKKLKNEAKLQQDFVNKLSRRMQQHALIQHPKYRFPPNLIDVRMIDFTHVFEENASDENYIHGLRNLITHLRLLLKRF